MRGAFAVRGVPRSFRCHAPRRRASTVLTCCILEARNSRELFGSLDAVVGERLPSGSHVYKHISMPGRFRLMCKRPAFFACCPYSGEQVLKLPVRAAEWNLMQPPTQA